MKIRSFIGYTAFFFSAVLFGYWIGNELFKPIRPKSLVEIPHYSSSPPTSQVNLLIFHVDRFKKHPQLRAIWLTAFRPEAGMKFIPIFPTSQPLSAQDQRILDTFSLEKGQKGWKPDTGFLNTIVGKGLSWNGTILLDDTGLEALLKKSREIMAVPSVALQNSLVVSFTDSLPLSSQRKAWQELCWTIMIRPEVMDSFEDELQHHIQMSIDLDATLNDWKLLIRNSATPLCEFIEPVRTR